jgi:hypothetical protein
MPSTKVARLQVNHPKETEVLSIIKRHMSRKCCTPERDSAGWTADSPCCNFGLAIHDPTKKSRIPGSFELQHSLKLDK